MGKESGITDPSLAWLWLVSRNGMKVRIFVDQSPCDAAVSKTTGSGKAGKRWATALASSKWEDFPSSTTAPAQTSAVVNVFCFRLKIQYLKHSYHAL